MVVFAPCAIPGVHLMLEVVALGGLGEFGMNMLALTCGETTIVVDAGVMFPDPELLGVDRIIPDLTYLQQKGRVAALVLTHGHEDHIGGVPHVLPLVDGPIFGTALTLALVQPKLEEHGLADSARLHVIRPRASWCTPATSRSTRRQSTASTSTSTALPSWAPRACWRCSPTARTSTV